MLASGGVTDFVDRYVIRTERFSSPVHFQEVSRFSVFIKDNAQLPSAVMQRRR